MYLYVRVCIICSVYTFFSFKYSFNTNIQISHLVGISKYCKKKKIFFHFLMMEEKIFFCLLFFFLLNVKNSSFNLVAEEDRRIFRIANFK